MDKYIQKANSQISSLSKLQTVFKLFENINKDGALMKSKKFLDIYSQIAKYFLKMNDYNIETVIRIVL